MNDNSVELVSGLRLALLHADNCLIAAQASIESAVDGGYRKGRELRDTAEAWTRLIGAFTGPPIEEE